MNALPEERDSKRFSCMLSRFVSTVGIEMPQDFPAKPYEDILNHVAGKRDRHPDSWPEFASAWNAVANRFHSCAEHDVAFTESIKQFGNSPKMPER